MTEKSARRQRSWGSRVPRLDPRKPVLGERCASMSTLGLLTLPYPFSQAALLTADQFTKESGVRGVPLIDGQLEAFHRAGILVPLFRVSLIPGHAAAPVDAAGSRTAEVVRSTIVSELFRAAADGRVVDPATEPYRRWPTKRHRSLWPSATSGFLWSSHQLLGLQMAIVSFLRCGTAGAMRHVSSRWTG